MRYVVVAVLVALAAQTGCGAVVAPDAPAGPGAVRASHAPATPPVVTDGAGSGAGGRAGGRAGLSPGGPGRVVVRTGDRLVVGSLGIGARIRRVGFTGDRLQIPASPAEIGIWRDGARPGDAVGNTVLVGHVSDNRDRPGVLARLGGLRPGAAIRVWINGRVHRFRMVQVRSYAKSGLPRSVFSQSGPHRLVLITCSHKVTYPDGRFHYEKNLVVTARPG